MVNEIMLVMISFSVRNNVPLDLFHHAQMRDGWGHGKTIVSIIICSFHLVPLLQLVRLEDKVFLVSCLTNKDYMAGFISIFPVNVVYVAKREIQGMLCNGH